MKSQKEIVFIIDIALDLKRLKTNENKSLMECAKEVIDTIKTIKKSK